MDEAEYGEEPKDKYDVKMEKWLRKNGNKEEYRLEDRYEGYEETDDVEGVTTEESYYEEENNGDWDERGNDYDEEYGMEDRKEGKKETGFLFYGEINNSY